MTETDRRQDRPLRDHEQRLRSITQTIALPDTQQGGEQRLRLHVPTHETQISLGARGSNHPIGPPGIALSTTADFAVWVGRSTIIDGDANMILHTVGGTRVLSQADLGISSNTNVCFGAAESIEITAGGAGFSDPAYQRQDKVPRPPTVDTAGPRSATESDASDSSAFWHVVDAGDAARTLRRFEKGMRSVLGGASYWPVATTLLSATRAFETLIETGVAAFMAAMDQFDVADEPSHGPSLKLHGGTGGVQITSPQKVSVHIRQVSIGAAHKLSIKAIWSATLKSLGNAKLYGIVGASVKSEGVASVQGGALSLRGDQMAELKSDRGTLVNGKQSLTLASENRVVLSGADVAVVGKNQAVLDSATRVHVTGKDEVAIRSDSKVAATVGDQHGLEVTPQHVQARFEGSQFVLTGNEIRIARRGAPEVVMDGSSVRVGRDLQITSSEIKIGALRVSR